MKLKATELAEEDEHGKIFDDFEELSIQFHQVNGL